MKFDVRGVQSRGSRGREGPLVTPILLIHGFVRAEHLLCRAAAAVRI